MDAAWKYQDVLANNIANADTAGFKREVGASQAFSDVLLSQQTAVPAPFPARIAAVVGQIGTGSFMAEFATDFTAGAFRDTGEELDVATDQGFFAVEGSDGQPVYTRDGHFSRDSEGDLVTSQGLYVLDENGQHINLAGGPATIAGDGTVTVGGQDVARLRVVDFAPADLARTGEGYFSSTAAGVPITSDIHQGVLEGSNTDMVEDMTTLLAVQRAYQASQTVLSTMDQNLDRVASQVGQFGR
jgi:flagellar basal-body rod protein FlgG